MAHLKGSAQWVLEVDAVGCVLHHIFDIYIYTCMPKNTEQVCVFVSSSLRLLVTSYAAERMSLLYAEVAVLYAGSFFCESCLFLPCFQCIFVPNLCVFYME